MNNNNLDNQEGKLTKDNTNTANSATTPKKDSSSIGININLDKLKESQKKREEFFKKHPDLLNDQLERKRQEKNQAKKEIIKKINADNKPLAKTSASVTPKKPITSLKDSDKSVVKRQVDQSKNQIPEIKIINKKPDVARKNVTNIGEKRKRLSYTLQMDSVSSSQVEAYRKRKRKAADFDFENIFANLNPTINKIYIAVILALLVLIAIVLVILTMR